MQSAIEILTSLFERGGWVMWPLMGLSVISVTICIERAWFWLRMHGRSSRRRLSKLAAALRADRRDEAARLAGGSSNIYARLAGDLLDHGSNDAVAIESVDELRGEIERFMPMLSTIITSSPLLGILGTVMGLIGSFQMLDEQSVITDPRMISGGIAEALITTATGLVIALVTLFPYMMLKTHVERAYRRMEVLIAAAQHEPEPTAVKSV